MKKFHPLNANNIPRPNTLLLCKRNNGRIYFAIRKDEPLSTNPDPSKSCFWFGDLMESDFIYADKDGIKFNYNFSDITVDSWAYLLGQEIIALTE